MSTTKPVTPSKRKLNLDISTTCTELTPKDLESVYDQDFYRCSIADCYCYQHSKYTFPDIPNWRSLPLKMLEHQLCKCLRESTKRYVANQDLSQLISSHTPLKWKSELHLQESTFKVTHKFPEIAKGSCIFWKQFGNNRFVSIDIKGKLPRDGQYFVLDEFYRRDFVFGGRVYKFMGGKKIDSKDLDEYVAKEMLFTVWYFAERSLLPSDFQPITVDQVSQWLADFSSMENIMKFNARLSLGFSTTRSCRSIRHASQRSCAAKINVIIIEDIRSASGNLMTDGCGFVHASIADSVHYGISGGVSDHAGDAYSRADMGIQLPAILQIRLRCSQGLFKGCLVVTTDCSLCPVDSVVMRRSMLKAPGSVSRYNDFEDVLELDIVNTFEHTALVNSDNYSFYDCVPTLLNRAVCLLLCHLGVPQVFFIDMMKRDIDDIDCLQSHATTTIKSVGDRRKAYKLGKLMARSAKDDDSDMEEFSDANEEVESSLSNLTQLSQALVQDESVLASKRIAAFIQSNERFVDPYALQCSEPTMSAGEDLVHTLSHGYSLTDPHVASKLHRCLQPRYAKLKKFKMLLKHSMYLVGAPDPCNVLRPGEVFVSFPCDGLRGVRKDVKCNDEGDVVVLRNPCAHPGDVRKLNAVSSEALTAFLQGTSGGIIFFSTQSERSDADCMGSGDFDGDTYLVILSTSALVPFVVPVEPFVDSAPKPQAAVSFANDDHWWTIFCNLCKSHEQCLVGRYSNAWVAFADEFGPADQRAIECCGIVSVALDAAKTNVVIKENAALLYHPKPHYLSTTSRTRKSVSVLGQLYDMVIAAEAKTYENMHKYSDECLQLNSKLDLDEDLIRLPYLSNELHTEWERHLQDYKASCAGNYRDNAAIKAEKERFRLYFKEDAILMMRADADFREDTCTAAVARNTVILNACMQRLASFIYEITYHKIYMERAFKISGGKYPITFCWEVCGRILNHMKKAKVAEKNRQHQNDSVLISEMNYLYT